MPKHVTEEEDFEKFKPQAELIKLDLACGNAKREGFLGVDIVNTENVDVVHDLDVYPWPFTDNSVFEIFCSHYVEHASNLLRFMEECYRILMPQCTMIVIAPYFNGIRAWQDHTHKRGITELTFNYFDKDWLRNANLPQYNIECDFKIETIRYYFSPEWVNRGDEAREFARKHYFNVVMDIEFVLRKIGEKK